MISNHKFVPEAICYILSKYFALNLWFIATSFNVWDTWLSLEMFAVKNYSNSVVCQLKQIEHMPWLVLTSCYFLSCGCVIRLLCILRISNRVSYCFINLLIHISSKSCLNFLVPVYPFAVFLIVFLHLCKIKYLIFSFPCRFWPLQAQLLTERMMTSASV